MALLHLDFYNQDDQSIEVCSNVSRSFFNSIYGLYIQMTGKEDLVEFINFAFEIIGVDISYQKFKEMSREERKSFLREIKLNKIL